MTSLQYETQVLDDNKYTKLQNPIIKSSVDSREYSYLTLENGLSVLLISDPEGDKSAAALDVHVGAQNDPVSLPGLAHFCEHLLFMGTEKYPKENDYAEYLAENAGYSNAYTSYDHTNYYFEVGPNHLEGALDRFSQFFTSSLFSASCTEREIKAVDSENKKNLQNDAWRMLQLQKSFSKKDHPFSRFSTGNLQTLLEKPKEEGIDTREELLKFYNKFYSSNIMKLVVSGKESIETLTKWVVPRFSKVRNLNIEPPIHFDFPTPKEFLKSKVYVVPVKDTRSLILNFEIPSQIPNYESKPENILSHFIGHEGPGSILSLLKEKSWATNLYCGSQHNNPAFCFFEIQVELTPSGLENSDEVVATIFQYIKLLAKEGIDKSYFKELQAINEANFRFQEKSNVSSYVSRLAGRLHRPSPPNEVLCCSSLYKKFDPEAVNHLLSLLNPDNLVLTLVSKSFQDRKDLVNEYWYNTEYAVEKLSDPFIEKLKTLNVDSKLRLPKPNPFVPTNFDLPKTNLSSQKHPVLLFKNENGNLWYSRSEYEVPKASICFLIKNPYCYISPRNFCYLELLRSIIIENLNEFAYDASIAGLSYELYNQYNGICIVIHGYSHKLEVLLMEVIKYLINLEVDESVFNNCKEKYLRKLQNSKMNPPYNHAAYYCHYALCEKAWTDDEKFDEAQSINSEEIKSFGKLFFSRAFVDSLVCGNFTPEDSLKIYQHFQEQFNFTQLYPTECIPRRNVLLPGPKCSFVHQKSVPNIETLDSEQRAYSELLGYMISEPAFNQLRTVEQLGYIVFGGDRALASRGGIRLIIQSERDPVYLESRIEDFLQYFLKLVQGYSEEEFQNKVKALISNKLKKDDNLPQFTSRKWDAINNDFYDFNEAEEIVSILKKANKDKVIEIIQEYILRDAPKRRKLSIHLVSQKLKQTDDNPIFKLDDCGTLIPNIIDWIAAQELSAAPRPLKTLEIFHEDN